MIVNSCKWRHNLSTISYGSFHCQFAEISYIEKKERKKKVKHEVLTIEICRPQNGQTLQSVITVSD